MSGESETPKCVHSNTKPISVSEVPYSVGTKSDVYECVDCGATILKPKESKA